MPLALDVLLPLPLPPLSYLPPLQGSGLAVGQRVVVPWQGGLRVGVVMEERTVEAGRGMELRHVLHAHGQPGWLSAAAIQALGRMARSAGVPAGTVLATLNPPGLHPELAHEVSLRPEAAAALADLDPSVATAPLDTWLPAAGLPGKALEFLRHQGLLDERGVEVVPTRRMLVAVGRPDEGLEGARRQPQRRALELLLELGSHEGATQLARDADVPVSSVRSLITRGYAEYQELPAPEPPVPAPPLTEERLPQVEANVDVAALAEPVSALVGGTRQARLGALLPVLKADLAAGHSVLVLAPEQAQAAGTAALLALDLPVSYLTGEASDAQRVRLWGELPSSGPQVLVGTYLALLAPLPQLGRVVVLDAGSSAYKLQSGARLLLPKAAAQLAAATEARFTLVDLMAGPDLTATVPSTATLRLPLPRLRLHVADLSEGSNWPVHPDLLRTLKQVVERGRQAIVLAPRRGFSAAFGCLDCGWQAPCPNCDLPLRFHRQEGRLLCHQCGHTAKPVSKCPDCGGTQLGALRGAGSEWIASQLRRFLEGMSIYRYDKDRRDDLAPLYAGEPGVVVGTLAVLGLAPLPELSLVGITHLDTHLAAGDFRAEEETTRMLLRLVELSGQRRPLVVVQTYAPDHDLLQALGASQPDTALATLAGRQLERRKRFGYPPFTLLAKLQFTARDRGSALAAAQNAADALMTAGATEHEILGPAGAPVERLRGRYVFHVLLRAASDARLESLLSALPRSYSAARLVVDVDPLDVGAMLE